MRALVRLSSGESPDCTRCAADPTVRDAFGCEGPAKLDYVEPPARQPTAWISCTCGGRDRECTKCDHGMRPLFHCPRRLVEHHPSGQSVLGAFRLCQHYPLLPAAGGSAEQSSSFMAALSVYQAERGAIDRERAKEDERERKRREKMAMGGGKSSGTRMTRG